MIACLLNSIEEDELVVEDESFVHLNNSLRLKTGDSVLAMDGAGKTRETVVSDIKKKKILLSGGSVHTSERELKIDLLLSPPKREALNDCLRMACELGIRTIYLFASEYCQNRKVDEGRIEKVLRSAVVQSNNPYIPEVKKISELSDVSAAYENKLLLHLENGSNPNELSLDGSKEQLLIIGPEGGFSNSDVESFNKQLGAMEQIRLKTPILRTPTALCVAFGIFAK